MKNCFVRQKEKRGRRVMEAGCWRDDVDKTFQKNQERLFTTLLKPRNVFTDYSLKFSSNRLDYHIFFLDVFSEQKPVDIKSEPRNLTRQHHFIT